MKDYLISMFIDEELDLDEKIEFVETVHESQGFKNDTVDLLRQEKEIRQKVVDRVPPLRMRTREKKSFFPLRPIGIFASGLVAALLLFFLMVPSKQQLSALHRFVIYQPGVEEVAITGSFTDWNEVPMTRAGNSGYWEKTIELPAGEYRFSYILEGKRHLADPTVLTREKDDFGGENSVLEVKQSI